MTVKAIDVTGPLLVFGGPYSNLLALRALQQVARDLGIPPDQIICTGDLVAYCAEPEETARAVRDWGCHVVAGNCEEQLAAGAMDCGCGFEEGTACDLLSKGWYPFALARTSAASAEWMGSLPSAITFALAGRRFRVVHGGVADVSRFLFASQTHALDAEIAASGADVVMAGHCGIPFIHRAPGDAVWFNPGVIGMPANDGTGDGWYGLVRAKGDALSFETCRLRYEATAAAAAMRRFGHANGYARTLVTGLWPSLDVLPPQERALTGVACRAQTLRLPVLEPAAAR